jgi:hypothetical protein
MWCGGGSAPTAAQPGLHMSVQLWIDKWTTTPAPDRVSGFPPRRAIPMVALLLTLTLTAKTRTKHKSVYRITLPFTHPVSRSRPERIPTSFAQNIADIAESTFRRPKHAHSSALRRLPLAAIGNAADRRHPCHTSVLFKHLLALGLV